MVRRTGRALLGAASASPRRVALAAAVLVVGAVAATPTLAGAPRATWGPTAFVEAEQALIQRSSGPVRTLPTVPGATCRPGDRPETGLQGQVPLADRATGRAAQGYSCNLIRVGGLKGTAFTTLDTYGDCAYYGDATTEGGVVVADVSDSTTPRHTAYLTSAAMKNPWESLKVHAGRGLLVAGRNGASFLDVYDVATDCRAPRLLASVTIPSAGGHEGFFSADGMTYWMTNGGSAGTAMTAVDLSDPRSPRTVAAYTGLTAPHGGSTSPDGNRVYVCQQSNYTGRETIPDALVVLDSSDVQQRRPDPKLRLVAVVPFPDTTWCQAVHPVTYGGKPYLIQFGERTPLTHTGCADVRTPQYAYPRIFDASDEGEPQLVSALFLEVDDPANCAETAADVNVITQGKDDADRQMRNDLAKSFKYDVHHCSPDRLVDPTVMACSYFQGGLRVFDIRDPAAPRELAYYNTAAVSATDTSLDMAVSRPVVRAARGEVWWTTFLGGLHVARFAPGVLPAGATTCSTTPDRWFDHYNPGACPTP